MNKELFELSKEQQNELRLFSDEKDKRLLKFATKNSQAIRKFSHKNKDTILRNDFIIDVDKILNNQFYNRYADKTQVFSFYKNDDITRRGFHVQLVSRIARTIGSALNLNLDLIEAISLGHDMGHTPFGHKGEEFLNEKYYQNTRRHFSHNVHSVRVLMQVTKGNLTLQTLDGILCHNGEAAFGEYKPSTLKNFGEFEHIYEQCYISKENIKLLIPSTLEGCVVRISDMIAYIGKDRQDSIKTKFNKKDNFKHSGILGTNNAEIVRNLISNIVKNSLGKNYLKLDDEVYEDLRELKKENDNEIYQNPKISNVYKNVIKPMLYEIYDKLLDDINSKNYDSVIFKHHINNSLLSSFYKHPIKYYLIVEPNEIVVDFIASMTDDYFIDLHSYLFPENEKVIEYKSYFEAPEGHR